MMTITKPSISSLPLEGTSFFEKRVEKKKPIHSITQLPQKGR
jgi:hypothetical protein